MRSVLGTAVGNRSSAGATIAAIIPHESPENIRLTGGAVDASDTLRGVLRISGDGRGNAQTFSYGGVILDEAPSDCDPSLVQATFIYALKPGLAG